MVGRPWRHAHHTDAAMEDNIRTRPQPYIAHDTSEKAHPKYSSDRATVAQWALFNLHTRPVPPMSEKGSRVPAEIAVTYLEEGADG